MSKTPIKRNKSLVVLSKEHHFGLLACWKIRQGITLNIEPSRMKDYVNHFWTSHLEHHFDTEENILFPTLKHELVDSAILQHSELRKKVESINEHVDNDQLSSFANILEQHIRFEERELFKVLQASLSEERLDDIGKEIDALGEEPYVDDYKDEFWIK